MQTTIHFFNETGQLVKKIDLLLNENNQSLSIKDLAAGIYILRIQNSLIDKTYR